MNFSKVAAVVIDCIPTCIFLSTFIDVKSIQTKKGLYLIISEVFKEWLLQIY